MPVKSLIVGVDLAPIKPIPRTTTFQGDITSDKCRVTIRQHFKTWKADTVLHDGAPNVGTAWVQDAFSQAELALQALKLAAEFLVEGGTFVTKVFRSKDYNALLWVCNQLFTRVEATKPPSSRNVSAEIFVVCRGFKAPKRIDPRLLDPRSVFAELSDPTPNNEAKVFNPETRKRKREGYEDGDYTQFREAPATDFVQTTDPIAILGSLNRLYFADAINENIALAALAQLPETTPEIRQCCNDLKVLGKKDFRMLLKWRLKTREQFGLASKKPKQEDISEEVAQITPMDEELRIQEELQRLDQNETARKKRERRRAFDKKQKEIVRMQMNMLPPTEIGLEQAGPNGEDSMFTLAAADRAGAIEKVAKGNMVVLVQKSVPDESDSGYRSGTDAEEDGLELELDTLYDQYQQRRLGTDAKIRAKRARAKYDDENWEGFAEPLGSSDEDLEIDQQSDCSSSLSDDDEPRSYRTNPSASNYAPTSEPLTHRAALFFDQDIFRDIGILDNVNVEDGANQIYRRGDSSESGMSRAGESKKPWSYPKAPDDATTSGLDGPKAHGSSTEVDSTPGPVPQHQLHDGLNITASELVHDAGKKALEDQLEPQKNGRQVRKDSVRVIEELGG